jgi:hypothetical protein
VYASRSGSDWNTVRIVVILMDDLTDAVALSLLWTTRASRRPRCSRSAELRQPDLPWPDGHAIGSLETRLHALGDRHVDAAAASLRAEATRVLAGARANGIAAIPCCGREASSVPTTVPSPLSDPVPQRRMRSKWRSDWARDSRAPALWW